MLCIMFGGTWKCLQISLIKHGILLWQRLSLFVIRDKMSAHLPYLFLLTLSLSLLLSSPSTVYLLVYAKRFFVQIMVFSIVMHSESGNLSSKKNSRCLWLGSKVIHCLCICILCWLNLFQQNILKIRSLWIQCHVLLKLRVTLVKS